MQPNAIPPIPITTERVTIRRPLREDMESWAALYSNPVVRAHLKEPIHRTPDVWWELNQGADADPTQPLSVLHTSSNEFLGICGFLQPTTSAKEWEIYCMFRQVHWRHGYATEVCRALIDVAFKSFEADRVIGLVDPANPASLGLVQGLGFKLEGLYKKQPPWRNDWQDGHLLMVLQRTSNGDA
jgi:[ribosomal protein S5]-alanine N-acetyltransferase